MTGRMCRPGNMPGLFAIGWRRLVLTQVDTAHIHCDAPRWFLQNRYGIFNAAGGTGIHRITSYNHRRYHKSLQNLTSNYVYFGRGQTILKQREMIKQKTTETRRSLYRKPAA